MLVKGAEIVLGDGGGEEGAQMVQLPVAVEFLREHQKILPPVVRGVLPLQITLFHQAVDLVGGIGLGDAQKVCKLLLSVSAVLSNSFEIITDYTFHIP